MNVDKFESIIKQFPSGGTITILCFT